MIKNLSSCGMKKERLVTGQATRLIVTYLPSEVSRVE